LGNPRINLQNAQHQVVNVCCEKATVASLRRRGQFTDSGSETRCKRRHQNVVTSNSGCCRCAMCLKHLSRLFQKAEMLRSCCKSKRNVVITVK